MHGLIDVTRVFEITRLSIVAIICWLLAGSMASAQATAALTGTVVDESGGAIADAAVTAINRSTMLDRQTSTDAEGQFSFFALPPGRYIVRVARAGFTPIDVPDVELKEGGPIGLRIQLKVEAVSEAVVVTAQRRGEERLQDVPLSVAVITADDIDRRRLVNAEDYLRGIPGVNQTSDPNGQSIVIRGLETSPSSQNYSSGPTVATYFGETPTTASATITGNTAVDIKLVDIERVEVLRGPQGTAFGSSALGGVVRTIPVSPNLQRLEAKVSASYSGTSRLGSQNNNVQLVGNVPIVKDRLAIRAVGYQFADSGYYRNVASSDPTFRAQATAAGAEAYLADADDVGAAHVLGGRVSGLFAATDKLLFTASYLRQDIEVNGTPEARVGTYDSTALQLLPEHAVRGQTGGLFDSDIEIANATVAYDLGWADLRGTYSVLDSKFLPRGGRTAASSPRSVHATGTQNAQSGEIRLATRLKSAWNFLAGVYAEDLDDDYDTGEFIWTGAPELNPFGSRVMGRAHQVASLRQNAAFGEVSWTFLTNLTLTGGARRYDYERTSQVTHSGPQFGPSTPELIVSASGTNLRGNLSYKINDDAMVYAGWAEGFRLGKPQAPLSPTTCDLNGDGIVDGSNGVTLASTGSLESDEADNYEIGGKFSMLDRRLTLDADVYFIDWTGLPVRVTAQGCTAASRRSYNANAGAARSYGAEFQASFHLTPAFRVDIGGSSIHAELTEDVPAQGFFAGDRLPNSPKVNANLGLQYQFRVAGYEAFVRADSIYVGSFYGDLLESANTKAGGYVQLDSSVRVTLGDVDVDLFVRNLTNEDQFTFRGISDQGGIFGYRPRPRTVGVQLGYHFGK